MTSIISFNTGTRVELLSTFIDEVRNLVVDDGNELWLCLTTDPLDWYTHHLLASAVEDQNTEDSAAVDRLGELYDQFVEFIVETTGEQPLAREAKQLAKYR